MMYVTPVLVALILYLVFSNLSRWSHWVDDIAGIYKSEGKTPPDTLNQWKVKKAAEVDGMFDKHPEMKERFDRLKRRTIISAVVGVVLLPYFVWSLLNSINNF